MVLQAIPIKTKLKPHPHFQNACMKKHHPANLVHDVITMRISGLDPEVGLNYQPDSQDLELIAVSKKVAGQNRLTVPVISYC